MIQDINQINKPRLLVITDLYPNPEHSYAGSFVVAQLRELTKSFDIEVFVPYNIRIKRFFIRPKSEQKYGIRSQFVFWYAYDLYLLYLLRFFSLEQLRLRLKRRAANTLLKAVLSRHNKNSFALIHCHEIFIGDEAGPIGRKLGIPSVVTLHSVYQFHEQLFGKNVLHAALDNLQQASAIIAVSSQITQSYQSKGIPMNKMKVIPNGVAQPRSGNNLRETLGIPPSSLVLLSVGTFAAFKKFSVSIHSLKKLHGEGFTSSHLIFAGKGEEWEILTPLVKDLKLDQFVHFLGEVPPENMGAVYRTGNILLHPSVVDGFSMVCLEAMSYGLAVVCTDAIGLVEFINPNTDAVVVPANNQNAFEQAVLLLTKNPKLRNDVGREAKNKSAKLSWTSQSEQSIALYEKLLQSST